MKAEKLLNHLVTLEYPVYVLSSIRQNARDHIQGNDLANSCAQSLN